MFKRSGPLASTRRGSKKSKGKSKQQRTPTVVRKDQSMKSEKDLPTPTQQQTDMKPSKICLVFVKSSAIFFKSFKTGIIIYI